MALSHHYEKYILFSKPLIKTKVLVIMVAWQSNFQHLATLCFYFFYHFFLICHYIYSCHFYHFTCILSNLILYVCLIVQIHFNDMARAMQDQLDIPLPEALRNRNRKQKSALLTALNNNTFPGRARFIADEVGDDSVSLICDNDLQNEASLEMHKRLHQYICNMKLRNVKRLVRQVRVRRFAICDSVSACLVRGDITRGSTIAVICPCNDTLGFDSRVARTTFPFTLLSFLFVYFCLSFGFSCTKYIHVHVSNLLLLNYLYVQ